MTPLCGDCRLLMPDHGPFDLIISDPPYGETSLAWDRHVRGWSPLAAKALKPHGSLWVFGSLRSFMATAPDFRAAGLRHAQEIVWEKQNGSIFHADRFRRVHELLVQFYPVSARRQPASFSYFKGSLTWRRLDSLRARLKVFQDACAHLRWMPN
ncbi:site-specific DNA-methyltransferase [Komagataeibacter intermedius]|uniref:Methyltransferase n=1 Tax=Komagataeibacter intermedius NRIC 0521 TaxID=1307934 RepID=A0ABQ0PG83_9PROT|nr:MULTISPECIES: DNA methyltransferase [Acetobacteraceae]MCF3636747.1 site-specific DNA-methyltransferase [Komagataeibacter intermedius]GAN88305.1 DNA methylase N-4/N-6 domain-containing protein [Komagataeibacter intermedius TF2]GBQ66615.1 hypothetical protein AA0521_0787 [Komagataeibacter intermedius NRIC 0521]